ncbi:hypothetical protein [Galbibacter sp. BG1]
MSEKKTNGRDKFEAAVGKVAKSYADLIRLIENSSDIEQSHVDKAFGFLSGVHEDSSKKANLSLKTALAANGGFSLDKEYDVTPSTARPARPERLVGQGKRAPKVTPEDDDDDGVGFLDE